MKTSTLLQKTGDNLQVKECLAFITCCTLLIFGAFNPPNAVAQNCPAGGEFFELDGNAITNTLNPPPDDWDLIFKGTSHAQSTTGILTESSDRLFTRGSKDVADVSTWSWTIQNAPPKDLLLNGGAALYNSDRLYFFGDRYAENGDAEIGFWFFKDAVGPLPNGSFSGHHKVGDILLLSNFVNGGRTSQIVAYEWVGSGGDRGTLQTIHVDGNNLCALVNSFSTPSPWPYVPKFGQPNIFPAGGFFEGGIVLSGLSDTLNPCFSSFILETRASQSLTAELKDFMFGKFLASPLVSVNSTSICVGGSATLTATVTGGSGPFTYSWSNGATTSSITVSPIVTTSYSVTVTPNTGCSPNPVSGTVTVNQLPVCNIGNLSPSNLICNNGNYTISSTATGVSYSWTMTVDQSPAGWAIIGSDSSKTITFSSGNCADGAFQVHFTLTVKDASGCTSTCTTSFAPGAQACNVSIRPAGALNCSTSSEYLLASYASDISHPIFSWTRNGNSIGSGINNGSDLDSILITSAGTYRFTVTDSTNSSNTCFGEVTVSMDTSSITVNAGQDQVLTCTTTSVTLTATAAPGTMFVWSPGGETASSIVVSNPGTYIVIASNGSGCSGTDTVVVTQVNNPPGAEAAGCHLNCIITSMLLYVVSPTAGVTYSWTGPGGFTSTLQNPSVSVAGTYTVTVTNPVNGCTSTATAVITQESTPPPCSIGDLSPSNLICNQGNYTVSSVLDSSVYTFSWSISVDGNPAGWAIIGSSTGQSVTFSAGDCGESGFLVHLTLTVTDTTTGCVSTCNKTFAPGAPACNVSVRPAVALNCNTSSEYLLASYATDIINPTFVWTKNGGSIGGGINNGTGLDSILISGAGTYIFTVTDPANSSNTCFGEVMVTMDTTPATVNAGPDQILTCIVSSVTLAATASSGTTLVWSPGGATTASIIVSAAGTYIVMATNTSSGCTATDTVVVTQNTTPPGASAAGCTLNCIITSMALVAISPTSGVTYSWTGPGGFTSTQQDPTVSVAGTYTVTVTNPVNGCTSTATATIMQNITPPPCSIGNVSPSNIICNHGNYSVSSGLDTTLYSLSWSLSVDGNPAGWGIIGSTTADSIVFSAGDCGSEGFLVHVTLTVTDKTNGCMSTCSKTFAPGAPACNVSVRPVVALNCNTSSEYLLASYATDIINPTFVWTKNGGSIGGGINSGAGLDSILISGAGTYIFTVTDPANSSNTCFGEVTVTQDTTVPSVNAGPDMVLTCTTTSVTLTATASTGTSLVWSPGGATTSSITVSAAGTYIVKATGTANGCTATDTVVVTLNNTPPGATAVGCQLTCIITSAEIGASSLTSGVTYSWTGPDGFTSTMQKPTVSVAGTYTVTVTNPVNGCTSTATAVVTQNITPPTINAGPDKVLNCTVTSVTLTATASSGATLSWSLGGATTSSITVSTAGTYIVEATDDSNGCTASDTVIVTQNITPPGASATGGSLTCVITSVQLGASSPTSGVTYSWTGPGGFTSTLQNPTVNAAGTYSVTVTNPANGCTSTATAAVTQNITPPTVNAGPDKVLTCTTTSVTLTATASSGTTLVWSPGGATTSSITVSAAGTYIVKATSTANGCTATDTAVVTLNNTPPTVNAGPDKVLTCTTTSVTLTATASSGTTLVWSPGGATTSSITVGAAGTYIVKATSTANGCTATDTAVVTLNNTPPTVNAGPDMVLTCTTTSVTLTATASSGTTLVWSPGGATTSSITVGAAGTYIVKATSTTNGCTATDTAVVTLNNTPPTVNAGPDMVLTCTTTSVTLTATASSGTTLVWSPGGATTSSITVGVAGTYIVKATSTANGCTATDTAVVTLNNTPPTVNAGPDMVLTCTTTSVTLTATASSGTTLVWSPGGATTSSITVSAAGTYIVKATSTANGCTATDTAVVTLNNTPPTVNAGPDKVLTCTTTSVTLTATASSGTTLVWSPGGATTSSITVSAAGTYIVKATSTTNGCTATDTAVVTLNNTPPTVNAGPDMVLTCTTTSVTLTATASSGTTLVWSPGGATTSSITVSAAGTYIVKATSTTNGCTATDTAVVTLNNTPPTVNAGPDKVLTCTTTSVTLTATASTGTTLVWSPGGATTSSITVSAAGTYIVKATSTANGCTATDTVVVTQNITPPGASATGGSLTCVITSVQVMGSSPTSGVTYSWTGPGGFTSTVQNPTVSVEGTYSVTVTNPANGCTSTATAAVTQNITPPTVNAGPDKVLNCTVTSVTLTATASAGTTLVWSPGGATTSSITVSLAGTYIVKATGTANGCTATDTVVVTQNITPPGAAAVGCALNCIITSAQIGASSPTSGVTYSWTGPDGFTSTAQKPVVSVAGTYTVTVTNPVNGCTSTATAAVTQNNTVPTVNAGADQVLNCTITSVTLTATASSGTTLVWSPGGQTSSSITVSSAGTYIVTATNTASGCTATDTVLVTSDVTPPNCQIGCTCDKSLCPGAVETLCTIGGYAHYAWSDGATTSCITISTAGTYSVTITKSNGCTSSCDKIITAGTTPVCNISGLDSICEGGSASLCAAGGNDYVWSNGATASCITVYTSGSYSVTVTNSGGCSSTCSKPFAVNPVPVCNITGNLVICSGQSTTLTADSGNVSYVWSTGATTRSITVSVTGTYTLTITDKNGCNNMCTACVTPGSCRMMSNGIEYKAYPNPFSTITTVEFVRKDKDDHTIVEIYSLTGDKVVTLFDGIAEKEVEYKFPFAGENLPNGVYMYRIISNDDIINGKLYLMR